MTNQNISFYDKNSASLFSQYQSISFETVHKSWIKGIDFNQCKTVLDIGAGSGRDALALMNKGLSVTAIEPACDLRILGSTSTGNSVAWHDDTLPSLATLKFETFDIILVSAVWMHLSPIEQTQSISRISTLLNNGGYAVITLRHGSFDDERTSFVVQQGQSKKRKKWVYRSFYLSKKKTNSVVITFPGKACVLNMTYNNKL